MTPAGRLPRRLLSLLVLRRGRTVSIDLAIDALWPPSGGQPADPLGALHTHVSRLRQSFPSGAITSVGDGYRFDPAVLDVDADQLVEALAVEPVGQHSTDVLADLDEILARWHGPAYPELEEVDEAVAEAQRLEELRVRVQELRAEHRLTAGDTDGLAAELRTLADVYPLREQPRALLMEALAATGRQADALRVFDDFRRLLGDELGVDPSPALAARHQELLTSSGIGQWAPEKRLPVTATSLIGRDELLDELSPVARVARPLSLVGPGGVGKTRLLLELGHRLAAEASSVPVVLAELARGGTSSAVDLVASALRIDARPATPMIDRIVGVVGDTELVLLLDNCEHVLDPIADLVQQLLARCPNLRIVTTSRERLRVPGEQVRTVPPLPVGDESSPAVQLFLARASDAAGDLASVGVDPTGGGSGLERVGSIVSQLDGLPLAIELAAARLHSYDIDEIAAGLDQRFEFLSAGYRTSSRHASLHAAVSWSFELLDDELRRTFTDLSVFAGPFEIVGAAAVTGTEPAIAAEHLAQLVERSLVMRAPQRRYLMLATLRAYGAEQLTATGRADEVAGRHARYQVTWLEEASQSLSKPGSGAIAKIDQAVPELSRALGWLLDHGEIADAGRLVASLMDYGFYRLRPDVLAWADRVMAADPADTSPFADQVWAVGAYGAWMAGDIAETGRRAARALAIAERAGGPVHPYVLASNGAYRLFVGQLSESADWFGRATEQAVEILPAYAPLTGGSQVLVLGYARDPDAGRRADELLREAGDAATPQASYMWYCAGETVLADDPHRAKARMERAVEIALETGTALVTGIAGASKASLHIRLGDWDAAARDYRMLIDHWRRAGMWSTQWTMLRSIAVLFDRLGRVRDAAVLEGAIRATTRGHRVFGTDETMLNDLSARLQAALGPERYDSARRQGAALDGDALLDYALGALTSL